jgi:hypothetical protein
MVSTMSCCRREDHRHEQLARYYEIGICNVVKMDSLTFDPMSFDNFKLFL